MLFIPSSPAPASQNRLKHEYQTMSTTVYSDRLGAISDERLQAALDRFELGRFISAEKTTRGLFGQNLFLTSTAGSFVLRGSPHNPEQLPRERFFATQMHERTSVPSPAPYLYEPSKEIFGWPFGLMRRMPGIQLSEEERKAMSVGERADIARAMGETLAAFGEATYPHCGSYDEATASIQAIPGGMREIRRTWMHGMLDDASRFCPTTITPDRAWIDGIVACGLDAEAQSFQATMATSDFGEGNAVLEKGPQGWRCSGVFDFMEYSAGDLEHAMARPAMNYACEHPSIGSAFLQAYASRRGLRPRFAERLAFYCLGDRLCIWNYGHSLATWFPPEMSFRAFAEPIIRILLDVVSGLPGRAAAPA